MDVSTEVKKSIQQNKLLWIEKFRPNKISSLLLNENVRKEFNKIITKKDIPNFIIVGDPGTGKTTSVRCIAREIYLEDYNKYVIELNASDDRGIKIEKDLHAFCNNMIESNCKEKLHKFIILDEADNITEKAQQIIGRLIEKYKDNARFALTCNSSYNIIEAIQSKCNVIFNFTKINKQKIILRLEDICDLENVKYTTEGLKYIAELCDGDLRSGLNLLELISKKYNLINVENVVAVSDKPSKFIIQNLLCNCINNDIEIKKKSLIQIKKLIKKGYNGVDIINIIFLIIKSNSIDIKEETKLKILEKASESYYIMLKGLNTQIQLYYFILSICLLDNKFPSNFPISI